MSFSGLLDHTARIWRRSETLGTYLETVPGYDIVYPAVRCTLKRKSATLSEAGPGTVDVGTRTVYFRRGVILQEKDLVEFVTGPDAPDWMEVESRSRPRGHHVKARCSEFHGTPPEADS